MLQWEPNDAAVGKTNPNIAENYQTNKMPYDAFRITPYRVKIPQASAPSDDRNDQRSGKFSMMKKINYPYLHCETDLRCARRTPGTRRRAQRNWTRTRLSASASPSCSSSSYALRSLGALRLRAWIRGGAATRHAKALRRHRHRARLHPPRPRPEPHPAQRRRL